MKDYDLAKMFWPEVAAVLPTIDGVLIPVGSFEQHGPMTPFEVDTAIARYVCDQTAQRIQERGGYYLVGPTINLGSSWYHLDFPGSVSLDGNLFSEVVRAVYRCLHRQGFRNIVFVNAHGGNIAALNHSVNLIRDEFGAPVYHVTFGDLVTDLISETDDCMIHAGEVETSICLAIGVRVDLSCAVEEANNRREALEAKGVHTSKYIKYDALSRTPGGYLPAHRIAEISKSGVVGDPTKANRELGERIIRASIDRLAELCTDIAGK